ncbi:uncharacterized protein F4807DRAFT_423888 [Annulohypoxylon truncatum]|uniref:uncharacterized protein n=1 Tax=Annulohypoxylon truncatum TaxID=327061 RepID=UPI002007456E|nr:uncharacterized protein F4807DRAFT_423888 [Annulohypoxylon truncatum]KAI1210123.1 hypothetical protein F4807DRAFT_423888 [Annulohypoxylon truncatum]
MDSPSNYFQAQGLHSRSTYSSVSSQSTHASLLSSPTFSSTSSAPSSYTNFTDNSRSCQSFYMMTVSDEEHSRAKRLVKEQSSSNQQKAATAVLSSVADGTVVPSTVMLVQALLDLGAEVCFQRRKSTNVLKIALNKDQTDIRSDLLDRAIHNCSHEIILLLAQNADEQAVNQAFPIAIDQNDPEKIRILLARGANASLWCSKFLDAVEVGSDEVVNELTRTHNGACQDCRDRGLIRAAMFGHTNKAQILLDRGANPNFERAKALGVTIHSGREDIGALIVSQMSIRVQPDLLDMAIGDAYSKSKYQILVACLKAREGGPTETVNRILLQAVERNQFDLVTPLLQSNASVEYQGGAVVIAAVLSRHHKLLQAVLSSGKASQSSMAAAISRATELGDSQITCRMVHALVSAGLRGDAVNKTLLRILDPTFAAGNDDSRLALARFLIDKGGAEVNTQQGRAFILAATEGWANILGLLIRYQPSFASLRAAMPPIMRLKDREIRSKMINMVIDFGNSDLLTSENLKVAAVSSAAEALRLDVLQHLALRGLSDSAILAGFSAAISSGSEWTTPSGLSVIHFLLDLGASGPPVDEAFCHATKLLAHDAIMLLRDFISEGCVNQALLGMIESSQEWHSPDDSNLWLMQYLLEWEAQGEPVNIALLKALDAYTSSPKLASKDLVDTLLTIADVNFRDGEALKIAIKGGDASLLQELAFLDANKETMTHAFCEAITAQLEEEKVLELLQVLSDREPGCQPDFERLLPHRFPPLFDCLITHPESVKLLKRLIKLGCKVDATALIKLYDTTEPEYATTLAWALSQTGRGRIVSSAVITKLIEAKANVNFTASSSQTTPLILAAKNSRGDIVKKLLEAKADSRSHDRFDKAALFYASQVGNIDAVKALLKTEFRLNDGSLHEAARNLHRDCVAALIKAKYDPNFRSSRVEYNGRNALQEMVYRCDGLQKVPDMEATILALEKGGANPLEKWRGKTALFLALSNPRPYHITQAFLNIGKWCESNNPKNVIEELHPGTGEKFYLSPTVWLRRTAYEINAGINAQLERLLKTMGCEDRYFAPLGSEQPDGAVGLPDDIAKEVKRRKDELDKYYKSEFEHQTKIRRHYEEEEAQHELWKEMQSEKTTQKVIQSATIHQNQLYQNMQTGKLQQDTLAQKNALTELTLQNQQQLKLNFQQLTTKQQQEALMQKNAILQTQQQLKLDFQQRTGQQKVQLQGQQNMLTRKAQQQQVSSAQRMKAIKASEEQAKLKAKKAMHREDLIYQAAKQMV